MDDVTQVFNVGDRVLSATGSRYKARNRGTVREVQCHGSILLVRYDSGTTMPVPAKMLKHLVEEDD